MANEFIIRKGYKSLSDSEITGSLNVSTDVTSSDVSINDWGSVSASLSTLTTDLDVLENKNLLSGSAQIASDISGSITSFSGSIAGRVATNESSISSLNGATGSYLLNTTDTLTGNLTVTGTLTAQEFHTEFVSASILFDSGSTKFGDSADDNHDFTGSVSIASGSLQVWQTTSSKYLNIFGGSSGNFIDSYGADLYLRADGNSNNSLIIYNSGNVRAHRNFYVDENVGIGTTSPLHPLHVVGIVSASAFHGDGSNLTGLVSSSHAEYADNATSSSHSEVADNVPYSGLTGTVPTWNQDTTGTAATASYVAAANIDGTVASATNADTVDSKHATDFTLDYVTDNGASTTNNITVGNLTASGNITSNNGIFYSGNGTKLDLNQYNAGYLRLLTDNTERLRVTATGDIGIGTTSPSSNLHVASAGNAEILAQRNSGAGVLIQSQASVGVVGTNTNHRLDLKTNGGTRVAIDTNGRVGIGTTSPSEELHINSTSPGVRLQDSDGTDTFGRTHFSGASLYFYSRNNTSNGNFIWIGSNGTADTEFMRLDDAGSLLFGPNSAYQRVIFDSTPSTVLGNGTLTITPSTSPGSGTAQFYTRFLDRVGGGTTKHNVIIDGKLGVGTTAPTKELHVAGEISGSDVYINDWGSVSASLATIVGNDLDGSGTTSYVPKWSDSDTLTDSIIYDSGTKIGIGTTTPQQKLSINGGHFAVSSGGRVYIGGANGSDSVIGYLGNDSGVMELMTDGTRDFKIGGGTGGTTMFFDTSAGNVGIGTTSPDAKLHVAGDVTLGQKRIVSLPSFNMGASSVTDEYLVICKQAPSGGGVNASGIQGRIVFSRGSSGSYNNSHYIDINIQMSLDNGNVNNLDINQFEIVTDQTVNHAFTQIEEIDISGTKYVALKARTTGGGAVNHFYFEGSISDDGADTNILSRVRASDANITVTSPQPSGYPIAPYVVKNNNGQVGIGVTPSYKLDVTGDSSSGVVAVRNAANGRDTLRSENASGTRTFNIANDGSGHGIVLVRNSSGTTTNYIGGSGNSYFNGGNIGIGTTSPSYLFEVNTSSVSTYVAHFTRNGTSLGGMYVDSISNGEFYVKASGNNTTVLLNSSGNSYLNGGNVGIGTTTPNSKLEVAGRVDFLNDFRLRGTDSAANQGVTRFFVNSSNTLTIDTANDGNNLTAINSSGYLGIRTASPSVPLHVASDETGYAGTLATTVTSGSLLLKTHATDSTVTSFGGVSGGGGYVQRSNGTGTTSYDMLINPYGGNVGIGLDNPSVTLHVDGFARLNGGLQLNTANAQIYQIQNSDLRFGTNNLERVRISSGGNVGIGTTTMDGKLDVHAANGRWRINSYGGMYFRNDTNSTHENYIHPRSNGDLSIGRIATGSLTGTGVGTYADTAYDQIHINANGTIELPAYAAGYLRADANGVITSDSVPDSAVSASHAEYAEIAGNADTLDTKHATDFTLDYVTDNGSSTSNSITLGPSAVNGGRILAQNYNASNVLGVISSQYSSGNLLIGYGLEGNNGGSGYLSTYGNFSGRHGAIEVFSKGFKYVGDTSNSQTAIGTAVTVTEFFKVDEGNLTTSGTLTVSGASGTINGNTIIHAGNYTSYTDSKYLRSNADDSTSGKLGVGTTAVSKFHVYQNDATVDTGAGITIEQDGTGDAKLQFLLTSVQRWVTGIDNSDGDSFKIGRGSDWSLGEHLVIDTSGNTTLSNDLTIGGDVTINGSHLELINGNNAAPQSTDYLFIGGDNLASADGAIYLGNRGDGTGYGYRIYYSGVGSGNNNKLILKSENLGSNVDMLTFTADGAATFDNNVTVGGTFTELSAKRFKENIQPLESQVDNINKLNPVTFDWKKDNKSDVGFIAEEVKEIYPDLVSEENGEVIGIQYSKLTAVLVKALQDQQKQIDELKQEIFILKQK